jgi:hypothetical protein
MMATRASLMWIKRKEEKQNRKRLGYAMALYTKTRECSRQPVDRE